MGQFAHKAVQYDVDRRGDGMCVAGKWISENLDEEDLVEFTRLAQGHNWHRIMRLSDNALKMASLNRHAHGICTCFPETAGRGACPCAKSEETS